MMLFAQVEPLSQQMLGMLAVAVMVCIVVVGGVVGIAVGVKVLLAKPPPPPLSEGESPVTKNSLDSAVKELNLKLDGLAARETVTVLAARVLSVETEQRRLENYTRKAMHSIRNELQYLSTTLAVIAVKLEIKEMPARPPRASDEDDEIPDLATGD